VARDGNPSAYAAPKPDSGAAEPKQVGRYALFLTLAVFGCAADLLTKHWIFEWRGMPRPDNVWWLIEGYVGIETALNPGALFGMGKGFGVVFAALSVAATVGRFGVGLSRPGYARSDAHLRLGLRAGGILGNLYDRLGLWHPPGRPDVWRNEVRDWILFRWGEYTWPNFNIADSLLVCGAMLLLWHSFRNPEPPQEAK
jgi:signal peptidase II